MREPLHLRPVDRARVSRAPAVDRAHVMHTPVASRSRGRQFGDQQRVHPALAAMLVCALCVGCRRGGESGSPGPVFLFGGLGKTSNGRVDEGTAPKRPDARAYVPPKVPLGLNLSSVSYYSSAVPFVDAMKMADPFQSTNTPLAEGIKNEWDTHLADKIPRDGDGYPVEAPNTVPGAHAPQILRASVTSPVYAGRYVLLFDGDGEFDFPASPAKVVSTAPGRIELDVQALPDRSIFLSILRSNRLNHVRNVRLILPGFEPAYQKQTFHPTFLARMRGVSVVRFMDWGGTNGSHVAHWSDRTTPSMPQGTPRGVAVENMLELANQLDADAWLCVPHLADDHYIEELAKLIKARLDPKHRVYIEYSNELWNGIFEQAGWASKRGCQEGLNKLGSYPGGCNEAGPRYWAGIKWQARRSGQIFQIFDRAFGNAAQRVIRVLAGQAQNEHLNQTLLESFENPAVNKAHNSADVLAVAPYLGGSVATDIVEQGKAGSIAVAEILDRVAKNVGPEIRDSTAANQKIARQHGLHLVAYEGGQHLVAYGDAANNEPFVNKLIAANRDPRMRSIYMKALDTWYEQSDNGLMVLFNYIEAPSKFGVWGLLESQEQRLDTAPKYQAFVDRLQRLSAAANAAAQTKAANTAPTNAANAAVPTTQDNAAARTTPPPSAAPMTPLQPTTTGPHPTAAPGSLASPTPTTPPTAPQPPTPPSSPHPPTPPRL